MTGATGLLGRELVASLLADGKKVVAPWRLVLERFLPDACKVPEMLPAPGS